jgi:hypothetical protein
MIEFIISLFCGLIALGIVGYAQYKAYQKFDKIDDFVKKVVKDEKITKWWEESSLGFWIIIAVTFLTVIEIAQWIGKHLAGVEY